MVRNITPVTPVTLSFVLRPLPHDGGGSLEMLPPGGANGRMEGDYLAVMGAQDGKNNPKWARLHGVFAGSSSWPYEYVPVAKEGEERPPTGKKWITVSHSGNKTRELQDTYEPRLGTKLHLGANGIPVGHVAVGGVTVAGCKVTLVLKIVNNLSSHCKLYDTNFVWIAHIYLRSYDAVITAQSNAVFYYSVRHSFTLSRMN